ncbi:flagellar protein [Frankia sp. Cj3]|uniref:flagellar protein n=1 Tax=Frankia sp. Cj3 TaxID=2880976 RepID=UPI001EF61A58|nr:flagellar protein [Frankia sp. Cj3]
MSAMPALFRDLLERASVAFVATFVPLVSGIPVSLSTLRSAAVAGSVAAVTAAIGILGSHVGAPGSASLDPTNRGAA